MNSLETTKGKVLLLGFKEALDRVKQYACSQGVIMSSFKLKFVDSYSLLRLQVPLRGIKCEHLDCFEYSSYTSHNRSKRKRKGDAYQPTCPLCHKKLTSAQLRCDELMLRLINVKDTSDVSSVTCTPEGMWMLDSVEKEKDNSKTNIDEPDVVVVESEDEVIDLVDSDSDINDDKIVNERKRESTDVHTNMNNASSLKCLSTLPAVELPSMVMNPDAVKKATVNVPSPKCLSIEEYVKLVSNNNRNEKQGVRNTTKYPNNRVEENVSSRSSKYPNNRAEENVSSKNSSSRRNGKKNKLEKQRENRVEGNTRSKSSSSRRNDKKNKLEKQGVRNTTKYPKKRAEENDSYKNSLSRRNDKKNKQGKQRARNTTRYPKNRAEENDSYKNSSSRRNDKKDREKNSVRLFKNISWTRKNRDDSAQPRAPPPLTSNADIRTQSKSEYKGRSVKARHSQKKTEPNLFSKKTDNWSEKSKSKPENSSKRNYTSYNHKKTSTNSEWNYQAADDKYRGSYYSPRDSDYVSRENQGRDYRSHSSKFHSRDNPSQVKRFRGNDYDKKGGPLRSPILKRDNGRDIESPSRKRGRNDSFNADIGHRRMDGFSEGGSRNQKSNSRDTSKGRDRVSQNYYYSMDYDDSYEPSYWGRHHRHKNDIGHPGSSSDYNYRNTKKRKVGACQKDSPAYHTGYHNRAYRNNW